MFDLLTNPYVIGYLVLIALLCRAGLGLQRMHEQNVNQRKMQFESDDSRARAASDGRLTSSGSGQDCVTNPEALHPDLSRSRAAHGESGGLCRVRADWVAERRVWVARSETFPDLDAEAPTIEALGTKLKDMVPRLLATDGSMQAGGQVTVELVAHRFLVITPPQA